MIDLLLSCSILIKTRKRRNCLMDGATKFLNAHVTELLENAFFHKACCLQNKKIILGEYDLTGFMLCR